jgi:protein-disulfide isomerase
MQLSRLATFVAVGLLGLGLSLAPGWPGQSNIAPNDGFEPGVFDLAGLPFLGDENANLAIVEFTDYQCPFCLRHVTQTFPQIVKDYVEAGKVRYVVRDFPLAGHDQAILAAQTAHCVGDHGQFWPMHAWLFLNQKALSPTAMTEQAVVLGANAETFQQCLSSGKYRGRVRQAFIEGLRSGVEGTPTFFFGFIEADGKFRTKMVLVGAHPYARFQEELDTLLTSN